MGVWKHIAEQGDDQLQELELMRTLSFEVLYVMRNVAFDQQVQAIEGLKTVVDHPRIQSE